MAAAAAWAGPDEVLRGSGGEDVMISDENVYIMDDMTMSMYYVCKQDDESGKRVFHGRMQHVKWY